jgi:choice-of-anchor C domain-containing protein
MTTVRSIAVLAASLAIVATGALFFTSGRSLAKTETKPCGPNLIKNGSFEDGTEPGEWLTLKAGSSGIDDWTITHGSVDTVGSLWAAPDGKRSIDLDGVSFGGISQDLKTEKGKTYVVSFDLAGNYHGPPTIKRLKVSAAGQSADFSYDLYHKPTTNGGWARPSFQFIAGDKTTTLEFDSLDTENGYFGPVIDDVRVQATCD